MNKYTIYENSPEGLKKQKAKEASNVIPLLDGIDGRKGVHAFVDFEDIVDEPQDSPLHIARMAEALKNKANDGDKFKFKKLLKDGTFSQSGDLDKYCAFVDIKKSDLVLASGEQQHPSDLLITKLTDIVMKTDENAMSDIRYAWPLLSQNNSSGFKETNEQAKGAVYVVFRVDNSLKHDIMKAGLPQVFENVFVHQDSLAEKIDELYNEIEKIKADKDKYINEKDEIERILNDLKERIKYFEKNFNESTKNSRDLTVLKQEIESLQNFFKEKGTVKSR